MPKSYLEERNFARIVSYRQNEIGYIPLFIQSYTALQELRLDYNKIKIIPSEIGSCYYLKTFTISHNLINQIPDSFKNLSNLSILIFNDNQVESFNHNLCILPIQILYFHNNKISSIPISFYKFSKLYEVSFDWFFFSTPNCQRVAKSLEGKFQIAKLKSLCKLLEDNQNAVCSFIDFITYNYDQSLESLAKMKTFPKGRNILHMAAIQGYSYIVKILKDANFELNELDEYNSSALLLSIRANQYHSSELLINDERCSPNNYSEKYGIPLHILILKKQYNLVNEILKRDNLDVNAKDDDKNNALHLLFQQFSQFNVNTLEEICLKLIDKGCSINELNYSNLSPAYLAIKKNNLYSIKFAIKYNSTNPRIKFDFNLQCGRYNWNSLHFAVIYSDIQVLSLLCSQSPNFFKQDIYKRTPRDLSLINSTLSKFLLKKEYYYIKSILKTKVVELKKEKFKNKKISFSNSKEKCVKNSLKLKHLESKNCEFEDIDIEENEASSKIIEYTSKIPFQIETLTKMNVPSKKEVSNNIIPEVVNQIQVSPEEKGNSINIQNFNINLNVNVNIIHHEHSRKILDDENFPSEVRDENDQKRLQNEVVKSIIGKINSSPVTHKLIGSQNLLGNKNNPIKVKENKLRMSNFGSSEFTEKMKKISKKEHINHEIILEERLLKRNMFAVEYIDIIKRKSNFFKMLRLVYYIFTINQKDSIEMLTFLLEKVKDQNLIKEIIYLCGLKGISSFLLNENTHQKIVEYEMQNIMELIKFESYLVSKFLSTKNVYEYWNPNYNRARSQVKTTRLNEFTTTNSNNSGLLNTVYNLHGINQISNYVSKNVNNIIHKRSTKPF